MSDKVDKMSRFSNAIILIAGVMWGVIGLFVRELGKTGFSSVQISSLRWIVSAIIVLTVVLVKDATKLKINIKDIWLFAFVGIFSSLAMSTFYFMSMELTSVAVSDVLMYTSPIWVIIFSAVFLREHITFKKAACVVFAFIGCMFVCGLFEQDNGVFSPLGLLWGICSGIAYALYSIVGKIILKRYDKMTLIVYNFIFAALGALFIADIPGMAEIIVKNTYCLKNIIFLAIIGTVLPFMLYTVGLKNTSASKAAILCCIEPVTAAFISVFILKESISLIQILGIGLIVFTIVLLQKQN